MDSILRLGRSGEPSPPTTITTTTTMDDSDESIQLPADTLQLLAQFNSEREARLKQFEDLKTAAAAAHDGDESEKDGRRAAHTGPLSMSFFDEDWNASQFWYDDETADTLAQQLLAGADADTHIAIVSAPSVYVALRNALASSSSGEPSRRPHIVLLEYDRRFEVVGPDFVFYDFASPLELPSRLEGRFDRIICDPPFLSEHCQTRTAETVRFLAREWRGSPTTAATTTTTTTKEGKEGSGGGGEGVKLISCTGERMGELLLQKLYGGVGVRETDFEVRHSKGLSNEFRCYANFECEAWELQ